MPCSYRIDTARRIVLSEGHGVLTSDELRGHQARLRGDPLFQPTFSQLMDLSQVAEIQVTPEAVRELAIPHIFGPGARRAIAVGSPLGYGLARIFETLREDRGEEIIELFRDLGEARAWLGIE